MNVHHIRTDRHENVGHWILGRLLIASGAALTLVAFNYVLI